MEQPKVSPSSIPCALLSWFVSLYIYLVTWFSMLMNVHQRRFAMEHADLLNVSENDNTSTGEGEPSRKRTRGGGKVPESKDFWAQFDKWFAAKITAWGSDLTSSSWKE